MCIIRIVTCRHRIRSDVWQSLRLKSNTRSFDKTIVKALYLWMNGDVNETIRWRDGCPAPHCNEECPEHIVLSMLSTLWGTQYKLAICITIFALSFSCAVVRIILQLCRYRLTKSQKQFIDDLASNPYREETLDVSIIFLKMLHIILCIISATYE